MEGGKQTRGVRNFFNFLEDIEVENPLGYSLDKWRKNVKIRPSGVVEIYPSDAEIIEAYNACPSEYKTFFKALVYTGNRFSQLYAALKDFNPVELTHADNTAHISSANLSHGTKRSYRLFFPAAFIPELEKIVLQTPDYMKKGIQHGRVSAKTIRKWHYNFMISHDISQAAADFMQGRAPATVGSANYLDKIRLSTGAYQSVVDLLPIPPTAGEKIALPEGRTKEPQLQQKRPPTSKKEKTSAPADTLNVLFASHKDGFYRYCAEQNIGMAPNHGRAPYNTNGSKASKFFSTAPEILKPADIPTVTDKKQVTALRLFFGEYLPSAGVTAPIGYSVEEWKSAVSYAKN
jgi:intergrase/recombinase